MVATKPQIKSKKCGKYERKNRRRSSSFVELTPSCQLPFDDEITIIGEICGVMSRKERSTPRRTPASVVPTSVCYCNGSRQLGTLELYCSGCEKWFHQGCLKDFTEFYGLNYMVCYAFHCNNCSPSKKESWVAKQANFIHMCVTVLANLTTEHLKKQDDEVECPLNDHIYFNLEKNIIPYFNENWNLLTSMQKRVKNTWHSTLQKTLLKETDLFKADPDDANSFALVELDLSKIGPAHEKVKQIGKKASPAHNLTTTLVDQQKIEKLAVEDVETGPVAGPKTRGASKRKNVDSASSTATSKKPKTTSDYSSARVGGSTTLIDIPFNKEGYKYHVIEKDPHAHDKSGGDLDDSTSARTIPSHLYRIATQQFVSISPNDRAHQLRVNDDCITGHEGYCVARATHSVGAGKWYFEVQFIRAPSDSAVRIGWAQQYAAVQACVGYNKFSYGWRSLKGTKFHNAIGKSYCPGGYGEGDVLGCLISLPFDPTRPGSDSSAYLPNSGKNHVLIRFKNNYFYEEHEEPSAALKALVPLKESYIEFFRNGKSCGKAFEDIYQGFYFPAVSLFHQAELRLNFGPNFKHPPPKNVLAMSKRAEELEVHQSLSDVLYLVEKDLYTEPSVIKKEEI